MARTYGKVLLTIWRDEEFRSLRAEAQRLYLFLISHPELTSAGTTPLRLSKWSKAAADTTVESIDRALRELEAHDFVLVDRDVEEILVRSYIKNDESYRVPNMLKALRNALPLIESPHLRARAEWELARALGEVDGPPPEPIREPLAEPMPEPFTEPIPEGIPNNAPHLTPQRNSQLTSPCAKNDESTEGETTDEETPVASPKKRRTWSDRTDEITRDYRAWYRENRGRNHPQSHTVLAKVIEHFAEVDQLTLKRALIACPTISVNAVEFALNRAAAPQTQTRHDRRQRVLAAAGMTSAPLPPDLFALPAPPEAS